jgi:hypothetical protein
LRIFFAINVFTCRKDEKNMDWMYKGERPEREEYLLGRRIDKHIEEEDKVEEDKGKLT